MEVFESYGAAEICFCRKDFACIWCFVRYVRTVLEMGTLPWKEASPPSTQR